MVVLDYHERRCWLLNSKFQYVIEGKDLGEVPRESLIGIGPGGEKGWKIINFA